MKRHFAFIVPPKPGHVFPTLPLVEALTARGHRVTYVTGDPMLPLVRAAGASTLALSSDGLVRPPPAAGAAFAFTAEVFGRMLLGTLNEAANAYPHIIAHLQREPPDAVCYDILSPVGAVVADRLGVPGVLLHPSMADNEYFNVASRMPRDGTDAATLSDLFAQVHARHARLWQDAGLGAPSTRPPLLGGRGALNLVFIPRSFQVAGETFDDSYRFIGPSLSSRARSERWAPPVGASQVLFISLGTVFNRNLGFFHQCIEAFANTAFHVVMVASESLALPTLPDNFEVAPSVPQLGVLSHARVCLCHTGMNSTMESLYFGVPLVSVPQMPEQAANGARVEELGLGRKLDPATLTAERLREAVDHVDRNPMVRRNVAQFSAALRAVDGATLGAEALEKLVG